MKTKRIAVVVPLALALLGFGLLSGCVFIPTFGAHLEGRDVSAQVGDEKSHRPLRLHAATRDQVLRVLGTPDYVSADMARIAYSWKGLDGIWLGVLCFQPQENRRTLLLTFDEHAVLRTAETLTEHGTAIYGKLYTAPDLPRDMAPPGQARPAATAPATRPSRAD